MKYRIQMFQPTKYIIPDLNIIFIVRTTIVSILHNSVRIGSFNVLYSFQYQNTFIF